MSRPKGVTNSVPSKEIQRQLLRDLTRKALAGDTQAAEVVLNYAARVNQLNSAGSRSSNNSTELKHG